MASFIWMVPLRYEVGAPATEALKQPKTTSSCCIPLLCPEQSGSLILCHAHTHCEKIRFSTPKRLWPGPFFLTISAGLQQQVEGQLLLAWIASAKSDLLSWEEKRERCVLEINKGIFTLSSSALSPFSVWERWLHFAHFIWLQNDNFHEYDSHFLSRDLRRKRFSDQLWGA